MKPGKIFRPSKRPIRICPMKKEVRPLNQVKMIRPSQIFMVVAVELNETQKELARYYEMRAPWVILFNERTWIVDIYDRQLMDLTPFPPWSENSKHNPELLKDFKHYVKIPSDD